MSGVIYKITTGNEIYVGSSNNFKRRQKDHEGNIYNENDSKYNLKLYKTIRANNCEWEMTIYEDNLSMSKDELCKYEEEIRLLLGATLNSQRAYRTKEQLKEESAKRHKLFYDKNKEQIKEKEKIRYDNNKEHILKNVKIYRAANKEKLNEKIKEKIKCECGSIVNRYEIARHRRTNKHITLMTSSA